MLALSKTVYIYNLFLIISVSMAAFFLVVTVLGRSRVPITSIRLFGLYFLIGCIGWIVECMRILGILKTYDQQIGLVYVLAGLLLLLAVAESFKHTLATLILVVLHGFFIYLLLDAAQLSSKLLILSIYALPVYGLIAFLSLRRGLLASNTGYLIIGIASLAVFASAIYQLYAMLALGNRIAAYTALFMSGTTGFVLVGIGFLTSILIVEQQNLSALALNDPLTGLSNRRGLESALPSFLDTATNNEECISVITIDIDYFKRINDTYGHDEGDKALKHVASALRAFARSTDVLARLGGEEFLLVLSNIHLDAAAAIAERCRQGIESLKLNCGGERANLTISLGVASECANVNFNDLLKEADEALYQAKSKGRNRVVVYSRSAQALAG